MNYEEFNQSITNEYIEGLIKFSGGAITHSQAVIIARNKFRPSDYYEGSPLIHKGPLFHAKEYVRYAGLLSKKYQPVPSKNSKTRMIFD